MSKNIRNESGVKVNIYTEGGGAGEIGPTGPAGVTIQTMYFNTFTNNLSENSFMSFNGQTSTESQCQYIITRDCDATIIRAKSENPATGGGWVHVLRKNGADTALTCTIATGQTLSDVGTGSITFLEGDLVSVICRQSGGWGGDSIRTLSVQFEI